MEDSPIVQEVPSQAHINPQLDSSITSPKQAAELNKALSDFWKETDEKEARAKEARAQEVAQKEAEAPSVEEEKQEPVAKAPEAPKVKEESKVSKPKEPKPDVESAPKKEPITAPSVDTTPLPPQPESPKPDALEGVELSPLASQEQKGQFKQLKEILKESQHKLKVYQDVFTPLLKELGHEVPDSSDGLVNVLNNAAHNIRSLRQSALTPEVSAELELLRSLQRAIDVVHAPEFAQQFTMPRDKMYFKVIDEIAQNCDENLQQFFKDIKEKYRPNNMDDSWWEDIENRMTKASSIERTRIHDNIAKLKQLQMDYDKAVVEKSTDQKGYQAWQEERQKLFSQNYHNEVVAAVNEAFQGPKKHIAHWQPQNENVKDPDELKKVKAHNDRFKRLQNEFANFLTGTTTGPRQAALNTLDYLEAKESVKELQEQLEVSNSEAEELRQEITKLKAEVDKRRKIADAPMKQTAGASKNVPGKAKPPLDGMKSLNEAMKNYNWPG